jgi:hypothetical protein
MAMNKKKLLTVAFISAILSFALINGTLIPLGRANPMWYQGGSIETAIQSPTQNKTYTVNQVPLTFNVSSSPSIQRYSEQVTSVYPTTFSVAYSLDDRILGIFDNRKEPLYVSENLKDLPEGTHEIEVFASTSSSLTAYEPVSRIVFAVDSKPPSVQSPLLRGNTISFYTNEDPLKVCFSIDGKGNATVTNLVQQVVDNQSAIAIVAPIKVTGNVDTSGLSEGSHTVEIYASDAAGNVGNSGLVQFTFNSIMSSPTPSITQNPISSPSPTIEPTFSHPPHGTAPVGFLGTNLPVEYGYAIVAVLAVIVIAGLSLVYLKKLGK